MLVLNKKFRLLISQIVPFLFAFLLCLTHATPVLAYNFPNPTASFYVNDTADLMTNEHKDYIIAANEDLCDKTGAQIVVVTIPALEGVSIEEYSTELFRTYGIGDAEKNNGILILLSSDDRECRIEVGYGLEGVINDAKAGRIMDNFMIPYFKEGNWDEGLINGFDSILDEICEEYGIEVEHNAARVPSSTVSEEDSADDGMLWATVIVGFIGMIGGLIIGRIFPNKALVPGIVFLITMFIFLIALLSSGYAILGFILAVLAYVIGWAITSPSPDGSYSSSYSSSSSSTSSYSSHSSSSRNSGGGGHSGGGGASRKF